MVLLLVGSVSASDIQGRDNVTIGTDMLTQLYDEVFPSTSQPQKSLDTTSGLALLSSAGLDASV
ncbi:unnamed protein product, partial [marine sediment metagenome]